jgi:hypothetical protein
MSVVLHQNTLYEIFSFCDLNGLSVCLLVCREWSIVLRNKMCFWTYQNYLLARGLSLLNNPPNNHSTHYLTTYYDKRYLRDHFVEKFSQFRKRHILHSHNWKEKLRHDLRYFDTDHKNQESRCFLKVIRSSDASRRATPTDDAASSHLTRRCGHASYVIRHLKNDYLICIGGRDTSFALDGSIDIYNLTKNCYVGNTTSSIHAIPSMWYFNSVKIDDCIYVFSDSSSLFDEEEFIVYKLSFNSVVNEDMECVPNPTFKCSRLSTTLSQEFVETFDQLVGSTMCLDPIPIIGCTLKDANAAFPLRSYRAFMFGGKSKVSDPVDEPANNVNYASTFKFYNDVYLVMIHQMPSGELDIIQWEKVETTGEKPSPRHCHSSILMGRNMYVFGGWSAVNGRSRQLYYEFEQELFFNDLFMLNIDTYHWTKVETIGIPPCPRCQCSMMAIPGYNISTSEFNSETFGEFVVLPCVVKLIVS